MGIMTEKLLNCYCGYSYGIEEVGSDCPNCGIELK